MAATSMSRASPETMASPSSAGVKAKLHDDSRPPPPAFRVAAAPKSTSTLIEPWQRGVAFGQRARRMLGCVVNKLVVWPLEPALSCLYGRLIRMLYPRPAARGISRLASILLETMCLPRIVPKCQVTSVQILRRCWVHTPVQANGYSAVYQGSKVVHAAYRGLWIWRFTARAISARSHDGWFVQTASQDRRHNAAQFGIP